MAGIPTGDVDVIYSGAVLQKAFQFWRSRGTAETCRLAQKNIAALLRWYVNRRFDRKYHVDTSGVVQLRDLTCHGDVSDGIWYEPTPVRTMKTIFRALPYDLSDFTFVDFGSGKGRALFYASNFNFRSIVGVEFASELHDITVRNIVTYRSKSQQCFDITSICCDATEFAIPAGPCVLYFFHPFRGDVMARVAENIRNSYERNPRRMIVLYHHPRAAAALESLPFLRKRDEFAMPYDPSAEPCIYRRHLVIFDTETGTATA